jgi:outer membrane protein assembly factor BamB
VETTPTASGAARATPVGLSPSQLITYPSGAILVLEPVPCRVQAVDAGKQVWLRNYPTCGGVLEAAVGRDSTAYVRAGRELAAIEREGAERWRIPVESTDLPRGIATPTTMADSRVVLADSPRSIVVYDADGKPSWRFALPSEEALVAPPQGLPTEGVSAPKM